MGDIADYYEGTDIDAVGGGSLAYRWDFSAEYSEIIENQIRQGRYLSSGRSWDEWKDTFGVLTI